MRIRTLVILVAFAAACSDDTVKPKPDFKPRPDVVAVEDISQGEALITPDGPATKVDARKGDSTVKVDSRKPDVGTKADQSKVDLVKADATKADVSKQDGPAIADAAKGDVTKADGPVTTTDGTAAGHLVINEIDYDQPSPPNDNAEFIEIYNPTGATVQLANLALVFVNGSGGSPNVYRTIDISSAGSLAAGQYLVVGATSLTVPSAAKKIDFQGGQTDRIENGLTDGVALINTSTKTVIDALSYEGGITSVTPAGFSAPVSLVEGTALVATVADSNTEAGSLIRSPNGTDTNNANADWKYTKSVTPGAANTLTP